jgi:hypothetical protein
MLGSGQNLSINCDTRHCSAPWPYYVHLGVPPPEDSFVSGYQEGRASVGFIASHLKTAAIFAQFYRTKTPTSLMLIQYQSTQTLTTQ